MWIEGRLNRLLTAALLTALIVFFGCVTARPANPEVDQTLTALRPPLPARPEMEPVRFEDAETKLPSDGGLWLSYNDYRALERNVIALREYAARLEVIIGFYAEE